MSAGPTVPASVPRYHVSAYVGRVVRGGYPACASRDDGPLRRAVARPVILARCSRSRARRRLVGILGWPVEHSLSPRMQNAAFAALGLDWAYVPLPTPPEQPRGGRARASPRSASPARTSRRRTSWPSPRCRHGRGASVNTLRRDGDGVARDRAPMRRSSTASRRRRPSILGDGGAATASSTRSRRHGSSRGEERGRRTSRTPISSSTRPRSATRCSSSCAPGRRSSTSRTRRPRPRRPRGARARESSPGSRCSSRRARPRSSSGPGSRRPSDVMRGAVGLLAVTLELDDRGRVARPGARRRRHRAAGRASAGSRRDRARISGAGARGTAGARASSSRRTRSRCSRACGTASRSGRRSRSSSRTATTRTGPGG